MIDTLILIQEHMSQGPTWRNQKFEHDDVRMYKLLRVIGKSVEVRGGKIGQRTVRRTGGGANHFETDAVAPTRSPVHKRT